MRDGYSAISGSEREPLAGASSTGPVPGDEPIEVTVVLRVDPGRPAVRPSDLPLSRDDLGRLRGAAAADVSAVESFAAEHGLTVAEIDADRRRLVVRGAAASVAEAFDVSLERFEHPDGSYRGHRGPVHVPSGLADAVVAVLGLDDRPQAGVRFRLQRGAAGRSYSPVDVAAAYGYPTGLDGSNHRIAFIELGGGYVEADLQAYFAGLGLRVPSVSSVSVDQGANSPTGSANGPDGEVMLDLEVAGAIANGAGLVAYFAPNTDRGFVDAVSAAVHDTTHSPSVISISWGGPESGYAAATREAFEQVLQDAVLAGVTVCAAAGDSGSSDGSASGQPTVDYPAASPQVLACGGTSLVLSGSSISSEVVWNDGASGGATGGGISSAFPLPTWQQGVGVPPSAAGGRTGRGVPDVAGNADPATGYKVRIDGTDTVVGGTSAVAPLWAALLALAGQQAGQPVGFVNQKLYSQFGKLPGLSVAFHDIVSGDNGAYRAAPGWDACTGLGSPKAAEVIQALTGH